MKKLSHGDVTHSMVCDLLVPLYVTYYFSLEEPKFGEILSFFALGQDLFAHCARTLRTSFV